MTLLTQEQIDRGEALLHEREGANRGRDLDAYELADQRWLRWQHRYAPAIFATIRTLQARVRELEGKLG